MTKYQILTNLFDIKEGLFISETEIKKSYKLPQIREMYHTLTGVDLEELCLNKNRMAASLRLACLYATGGAFYVKNRLEKIEAYKEVK